MKDIRIIGLRGTCRKSVAVLFSNKKEAFLPRNQAIEFLGKRRFQAFVKKEEIH